MPTSIRPGDELAGRYRLEDLLHERDGGRFFRAWDLVLARHVAVHVISAADERAEALRRAARQSVAVQDPRVLRVLDIDDRDGICFVVNEWGTGRSLDHIVAEEGPLVPRRAAWLASEVAGSLALAHEDGVTHGRLIPENVLIDQNGRVRLIGLACDAALHGLPPGRVSADLTDLAGILYTGLTARWAGVSRSAVPEALLDGPRVLRPRQVRAGIPRDLDQLCDDLLNDSHHVTGYDLGTASGIAAVLRDFVGDCQGVAGREALLAATAQVPPLPAAPRDAGEEPTIVVPVGGHQAPPRDEGDSPAGDEAADRTGGTETTDAVDSVDTGEIVGSVADGPGEGPEPVDEPTQAGMPVFHDDAEDVGWFSREPDRSPPPPPPPPLEEPTPKPLFAPEPEGGRPARVPRAGSMAYERGDEYGGRQGSASHANTGTGLNTGSGLSTGSGVHTGSGALPIYVDDTVPGRRWLRLAMGIAAIALVGILAVFGAYLVNGRQVLGDGSSAGTDGPSGTPQALADLSARDIDPQGSGAKRENPETVGNTVDGDKSTTWSTLNYRQNFGPGGLKTGLGVVVDLGEVRAPRTVEVTVRGSGPTGYTLYLANQQPSKVAGLSAVAQESGKGTITTDLGGADRGRYLVVWLTSLPRTGDGQFRGTIAEIRVTV